MTAGATRTAATALKLRPATIELEVERPYAFTVGVRSRLGSDLEGLEAHGDGISFRSPQSIEGGRIVELEICRTILVEAEVVGCAAMTDRADGYWVRARFHKTSPALNALICHELNRLMTTVD